MSKGGGGKQTVQQNADPWSGVQPYMTQGFDALQQIFQRGTPGSGRVNIGGTTIDRGMDVPDYYPKSTIAPMSGYTQGAINAQAQRAAQGSPLVDAAQSSMQKTLGGQYLNLNSNPHLRGAIDYATQPMTQAYNTSIAPGLDSAFSSAGRYGSNQHQTAQGQAADALMRNIGGVSSSMANQQYGAERDRMMQAGMLAPQLAQQDYFDINQLGASGAALDAYKQAQINADIDRWNYNQDADWNRAKDFLATLTGGTQWGGTTTSKGAAPNTFTSALGGASTGAGIASLLGLGTGWGTAATGVGALLGAVSDERAKENIRTVGRLNNGLPVYVFNYIGDPVTQIGLMAQDVEKVHPEAVTEFDGLKRVRYDLATENA